MLDADRFEHHTWETVLMKYIWVISYYGRNRTERFLKMVWARKRFLGCQYQYNERTRMYRHPGFWKYWCVTITRNTELEEKFWFFEVIWKNPWQKDRWERSFRERKLKTISVTCYGGRISSCMGVQIVEISTYVILLLYWVVACTVRNNVRCFVNMAAVSLRILPRVLIPENPPCLISLNGV